MAGLAGQGGKAGSRLPHVIRRSDGQPMAFAALWEVWHDKENPNAKPLQTCVIITTSANKLMRPIHDRMPVILDPADWTPGSIPTPTTPAL
jgi:putative SOS response-associated peptidase YedK